MALIGFTIVHCPGSLAWDANWINKQKREPQRENMVSNDSFATSMELDHMLH